MQSVPPILTRSPELGWESKFSIDWNTQPERAGTSLLYGHITSHYGEYASPFRVLGIAVDSSGKAIGQRIEWVPGGIPGFAHVYFEIGHLPVAPSYKVTVWDYTFIDPVRKRLWQRTYSLAPSKLPKL